MPCLHCFKTHTLVQANGRLPADPPPRPLPAPACTKQACQQPSKFTDINIRKEATRECQAKTGAPPKSKP